MESKKRKGDNQKLKMLYLVKLFSEETDDRHYLTMSQIIEKLAECGVNADRKTIYLDLEELRHFGMDIIADKRGRECFYYLGGRDFELPELKLLVDSVQSAKFITDRKSKELIKKLESLASRYEGSQLNRQVFISGRIKTMNESIYYNIDKLHEAIGADSRIRFKYYQWNVEKQMELRRDGAWYEVSPWGLIWDDENYYLVGYDAEEGKIKHYRVDKMLHIEDTGDPREGGDQFKAFNMPSYSK
ncbi:MAG: WYL domain-containing protein, partial [Firmicutes bacterium]|nr:WYL domain-containing protein [Bacillota bacterium]